MSSRPTIICVTPIRNERWILATFLRAASVWADHIILADQGSEDGSRELAASFPKVRVIANPSLVFNEAERRDLLMAEARKFPEPRLIFGLDADELLSADLFDSPEWETVLNAPPGTAVHLQWVNLFSAFSRCHVYEPPKPFAYMDDGRAIESVYIHSPRIPENSRVPALYLSRGKVLHYQYLDWQRMKAKHRWYQCLERIKYPGKSAVAIYRMYHHMDISWARQDPVLPAWFSGYEKQGIDVTSLLVEPHPIFERDTLKFMEEHGAAAFRRLAIWDVNWPEIAAYFGLADPGRFRDPRSALERRFHRWLEQSNDHPFTWRNTMVGRFYRLFLRW